MGCSDLSDWYLRPHLAVLDLGSAVFRRAWEQTVSPGYSTDVCMRRLVTAKRVRRIGRGLYVAVDPVRATPPAAIACGVFAESPHYITTDAAFAHEGLIDQPIPRLTVVLPFSRRPIRIDETTAIRPVTLDARRVRGADAYDTTVQGFAIRVASREQAMVDALVEPHWMVHGDLLGEVLEALSDAEILRVADAVLAGTTASAQRLGYLLEEAGRSVPGRLAELRPVRAVRLRPHKQTKGPYSSRWRVYG